MIQYLSQKIEEMIVEKMIVEEEIERRFNIIVKMLIR
jgi:hypothetical protein